MAKPFDVSKFRKEITKSMKGQFTVKPPEPVKPMSDRELLEAIWAKVQTL